MTCYIGTFRVDNIPFCIYENCISYNMNEINNVMFILNNDVFIELVFCMNLCMYVCIYIYIIEIIVFNVLN